jgi:dihydroxy-acid dehydratase
MFYKTSVAKFVKNYTKISYYSHKRFSNINKFSCEITQKKERGAAQAMLYSLGLTKNDMNKAQVAVASMWYSGNPCNSKLNIYSDAISSSIQRSDKMIPMQFNTIGVSDGISMGTPGMRYSLPSRELIADSIETVVSAQHYDGVICIPGCDKNLPGSLMGISRLNRPSLIVYGGSMRSTEYKGTKLDIVSAFESYGKYTSGKISEDERLDIIQNSCDKGCGSCSGLYTANTMAVCLETLGMMLPNSSSSSPGTIEKSKECMDTGNVIQNLLEKDIKPSDILTKESFLNAITATYAFGGSTNAVIHLLACANSAGIDLKLDDFQNLNHIPVILNMKPHGEYVMYDLSKIGGTARVTKYLIQKGLLNGNCITVTGNTLWENVKDCEDMEFITQNLVLPLEKPFKNDGHIKILKGNLSPNGCLSKIYKKEKVFKGKACVFDNENDMVKALSNNEIKQDSFVIIRYQGESIGCPEMLTPTSALIGHFGSENAPPLATDGRFSGGSHGILIAHLPDAYKKNSLTRIIKNNDDIEINLSTNEINLLVDDEQIKERLNNIPQKELTVSGYLKKFSKLCGTFQDGYIT